MADGAANEAARQRLMAKQSGRCLYCERPLNQNVKELRPILEHYRPRSRGGKRTDLVLACATCDRMKGMMHGDDFSALVLHETVECGRTFSQARAKISAAARAENYRLQEELRVEQAEANKERRDRADARRRPQPDRYFYRDAKQSQALSKLAEMLRPFLKEG